MSENMRQGAPSASKDEERDPGWKPPTHYRWTRSDKYQAMLVIRILKQNNAKLRKSNEYRAIGRDLHALAVEKLYAALQQIIAVSTRSGDLAQIRLIAREALGVEGPEK